MEQLVELASTELLLCFGVIYLQPDVIIYGNNWRCNQSIRLACIKMIFFFRETYTLKSHHIHTQAFLFNKTNHQWAIYLKIWCPCDQRPHQSMRWSLACLFGMFYCLSFCSRVSHKRPRDVPIASEELQYFNLYSALIALEPRGIFIVLWLRFTQSHAEDRAV